MKSVILIAHDARRNEMIDWARSRRGDLFPLALLADGPTGREIASRTGLSIDPLPDGLPEALASAGNRIEEGLADFVVFFPKAGPAEVSAPDTEAFLCLADLHEVPTAINPWTADFFLSSLKRGARSAAPRPGWKGWPARRAGVRVPGL